MLSRSFAAHPEHETYISGAKSELVTAQLGYYCDNLFWLIQFFVGLPKVLRLGSDFQEHRDSDSVV